MCETRCRLLGTIDMNTSRHHRIGAAAVAALLVWFAAALALFGSQANAAVINFQQPLAGGQSVVLSVPGDLGGNVHVSGWDRTSVELRVEPKGTYSDRVALVPTSTANALRLDFALKVPWSLRSVLHLHDTEVKVVMHVPRSARLSVFVVNGPVDVAGVSGPLAVKVTNGPIT